MAIFPFKSSGADISPIRKFFVWAFIIGFWLLFYWYNGAFEQSPEPQDQKEPRIEKRDNKPF
ncbi:MAG: hypothetical protein ACE5G9_10830 [Nitrospinales bacterium]